MVVFHQTTSLNTPPLAAHRPRAWTSSRSSCWTTELVRNIKPKSLEICEILLSRWLFSTFLSVTSYGAMNLGIHQKWLNDSRWSSWSLEIGLCIVSLQQKWHSVTSRDRALQSKSSHLALHPGLPKPLSCLSNSNCALLEGLAASGVTKVYRYCGYGRNNMCDQGPSITTKPHLFGWSPESYCSPLLRLNQPWTPILSLWYLAILPKPNLQNSKAQHKIDKINKIDKMSQCLSICLSFLSYLDSTKLPSCLAYSQINLKAIHGWDMLQPWNQHRQISRSSAQNLVNTHTSKILLFMGTVHNCILYHLIP